MKEEQIGNDRQPQVLFVSDDPQASQARLLALGVWGIGGSVERTVEEGAARWAIEGYDLLVIDVHTRAFDGIGACRELRGVSVNPLLLMGYSADERDIIDA